MGAVGGTVWHSIKGARNSPRVSTLPLSLTDVKFPRVAQLRWPREQWRSLLLAGMVFVHCSFCKAHLFSLRESQLTSWSLTSWSLLPFWLTHVNPGRPVDRCDFSCQGESSSSWG